MKIVKTACKAIETQPLVSPIRGASRPWARAMLDVLQRRGRTYGLLALYEESRLNALR